MRKLSLVVLAVSKLCKGGFRWFKFLNGVGHPKLAFTYLERPLSLDLPSLKCEPKAADRLSRFRNISFVLFGLS